MIQITQDENGALLSDDRAILPAGMLDPIFEWLQDLNSDRPDQHRRFRLPMELPVWPMDGESPDFSATITERVLLFEKTQWAATSDNVTRLFMAARSLNSDEPKYEILGPEVARRPTVGGYRLICRDPISAQLKYQAYRLGLPRPATSH
jgi:hypothetical protein